MEPTGIQEEEGMIANGVNRSGEAVKVIYVVVWSCVTIGNLFLAGCVSSPCDAEVEFERITRVGVESWEVQLGIGKIRKLSGDPGAFFISKLKGEARGIDTVKRITRILEVDAFVGIKQFDSLRTLTIDDKQVRGDRLACSLVELYLELLKTSDELGDGASYTKALCMGFFAQNTSIPRSLFSWTSIRLDNKVFSPTGGDTQTIHEFSAFLRKRGEDVARTVEGISQWHKARHGAIVFSSFGFDDDGTVEIREAMLPYGRGRLGFCSVQEQGFDRMFGALDSGKRVKK